MIKRGWRCYYCNAPLTSKRGKLRFDLVNIGGKTYIVCKGGCKE